MPRREVDRLSIRREQRGEDDQRNASEPPERGRSGRHTHLFVGGKLYASPDSTRAPLDGISSGSVDLSSARSE